MSKKRTQLRNAVNQELTKTEENSADLTQIYQKFQTIYESVSVHITQILMNLNNLEKDIKGELSQYWMKDLPLRKTFDNYSMNIANLIGLYNQLDDSFKKTFQEIMSTLDNPEIKQVVELYEDLLAEYKQKAKTLVNELEKKYERLKADYEEELNNELIKNSAKIHREYKPLMEKLEKDLRDKSIRIRELEQLLLIQAGKKMRDTDLTSEREKNILKAYFSDRNLALIEREMDAKIPFEALEWAFDKGILKGKDENQVRRREFFFKISIMVLVKKKNKYKDIKDKLTEDYNEIMTDKYLSELIQKKWIKKKGKGNSGTIELLLDEDKK